MKKNLRIYDAIADIALNVGHLINDNDEFDSRKLVSEIVDWAKEFKQLHKDTDWEESNKDYILTIDSFSKKKWYTFIGKGKIVVNETMGLFDSAKTEQDVFDLFVRIFSEDMTSYEPEDTYEDRVYCEACEAFSENCDIIESRIPWLKEDDSDDEAWYDRYHDEVVSLYCSMLKGEVRRCDHCGKPMKEGYYLGGEFACDDECCLALYNGDKKQMEEDLSHALEDDGDCYWTEWESIYYDD